MKKISTLIVNVGCLLALLAISFPLQAQQVTGLDNWTLMIDPGHSRKENMGLFNYSEAEKVLRVSWALRDMFEQQTDIEAVYLTRDNDVDEVSLGARTDMANQLGVDFFYSVHSDAGASSANSTLMLYGGWRSNGVTVEKTPNGGRALGEILNADLSGAMRIPTRGNFADRVFYLGEVQNHDNQFPYLFVNRTSNMASLLSEGGFHTNPRQQQLNMNAEWKVLEALSAFRSILEFRQVDRPAIGVVAGIITDVETGLPINGATVTLGELVYTTDTYESVFSQYSTDPEALRNGFYFIDGLTPASEVSMEVGGIGYMEQIQEFTLLSNPNGRTAQNITFRDIQLVSSRPAQVVSVTPDDQWGALSPTTPITITFSRKMDWETVEEATTILPEAALSFTWLDDFRLVINTSELAFLTEYELTVSGAVAKNALTSQFLDGDGNGEEGGDFALSFTTSDLDINAPQVIAWFPEPNSRIDEVRPAIRIRFDEPLDPTSVTSDALTLWAGASPVPGTQQILTVNELPIIHFYPSQSLEPHTTYTVKVAGGIKDPTGNETEPVEWKFTVGDKAPAESTLIDSFDALANWWEPAASGSTTGIDAIYTGRNINTTVIHRSLESTASLQLNYGWDTQAAAPYIRFYLPPTATQNQERFNASHHLQIYMFGDGSGNQFRFVIRDGENQLEAGPWVTIDWVGWKLVTWDLANQPATGWVNGNGVLEGTNFYMDGLHFRYVTGALERGSLYFENLQFVSPGTRQFTSTFSESFETYPDFTTEIFPWTTVDVKGDITWNPQGFTFPGSGQAYAFKVLNPQFTDGPIVAQHPAQHGDKYLIAMQSQTVEDDKWLISPQYQAKEFSRLSFYAKSISDTWGLERFQVLILEDEGESFSFDAAQFQKISESDYVEAPLDWTKFSYDLSALDGKIFRFAVRGVSYDSYMLMLDNFVLNDEEEVVVGVPLYPSVEARVYPNPASDKVQIVTEAPIKELQLMGSNGAVVHRQQGNSQAIMEVSVQHLPPGLYLVRVVTETGLFTGKVIVKK
jgi:N-acetylmuramoyl-L-alanine amidase